MKLNAQAVGLFLQTERKRSGLTQAEMAEKLSVSPQSVSNWERGESLPDVSILPDIAGVLHCSVDAILSGGTGCGGFRRHILMPVHLHRHGFRFDGGTRDKQDIGEYRFPLFDLVDIAFLH